MRSLGLYRIHHPLYREGVVVIAREVICQSHPGEHNQVVVDGIPLIDFCGASWLCDLTEDQAEKISNMVEENVVDEENIE